MKHVAALKGKPLIARKFLVQVKRRPWYLNFFLVQPFLHGMSLGQTIDATHAYQISAHRFSTHFGPEVPYSKNWVFPGNLLWYNRWQEILREKPQYVEIVTWND